MMTAVLLDSIQVGSTSWFVTRRGNGVKVQGVEEGDRVRLWFGKGIDPLSVEEDGFFPFPDGTLMVRAEHLAVAERKNGGVCIDIVRKRK